MQATLAVHHFDPLRDRETANTMRATPDRGLEAGFTEKCERPAGWPLSVVRDRHACAYRADADARATFWGEEHARSLVSLAVVGLSHRHRRR
jgi:hypothetical protein